MRNVLRSLTSAVVRCAATKSVARLAFTNAIALTFALPIVLGGCDSLGADGDDAGADGGCGASTCSATQICLYRDCSTADRCRVATSCLTTETPTTCPNGQPGCLAASCSPVLQGCRDIPASCGNDVTCACGSICGSPAACKQVTGRNALCAGQ